MMVVGTSLALYLWFYMPPGPREPPAPCFSPGLGCLSPNRWEQNYPPSLSELSNYDFLIIFKGKFIGLGQDCCSLRVSYIFFLISWVQCQAEPLFIFKTRNERTNCHDTPYCYCLIISIDNMNPSWFRILLVTTSFLTISRVLPGVKTETDFPLGKHYF